MEKKEVIYKIIEIICTAIISIAAVLTVQSCVASLSLNKAGNNQKVETTTTNSVDSTHVIIQPKQ